MNHVSLGKVKVHTLDIVPLHESSPLKRSGMARVLKGFHGFTCTPTRSSAIGMSHTLPLPSQPQLLLVLIYRPQRDGMLSWPGFMSQFLLLVGSAERYSSDIGLRKIMKCE